MGMRAEPYCTFQNADAKCEAWLGVIRGDCAPRLRLRLDPRRSALLVVDMVRHFVEPSGRCFLPAAPAAVERAARLADAYRRLGAPVMMTRHGHRGPEDLGMFAKFYSDYLRHDEPDAQIVSALASRAGEPVLLKNTYDAFLNTPLEELLSQSGKDQVVLCGVLTHLCCETTARSAFCRGFEVFLPVDALATTREDRHVASLKSMADGVGVPLSVVEVEDACRDVSC